MEKQEIYSLMKTILETEKELSAGMAAIRVLLKVLEKSNSKTIQELREQLIDAIAILRTCDCPITAINSGSELFLRFITLTALDTQPFEECKKIMLDRGNTFYERLVESRQIIAQRASIYLYGGQTILTHSRSRVVLAAMKRAAEKKCRFRVYITQSTPDTSGAEMVQNLRDLGIPCTMILDSAMGYIMESVDFCMVGAEGVCQSGGIINKIGTYQMALCAKALNKRFLVMAETFKFTQTFPLNNRDLEPEYKFTHSMLKKDTAEQHPLVDYTPPELINLFITDIGILPPTAVADELLKLYL
ncbi:translation initiation factor eIF-2B subunit alpha [Trichogramma pretiosum]|uniref:translation initiation factor eIF-2B subunit alpha n=1 Tax=Trichogramma pretiosum TaxID=7493 RepID=UPI0006C98613|nr:translation initiation factor eIF-2B subunit alpha [Trichogramma pretiosum]